MISQLARWSMVIIIMLTMLIRAFRVFPGVQTAALYRQRSRKLGLSFEEMEIPPNFIDLIELPESEEDIKKNVTDLYLTEVYDRVLIERIWEKKFPDLPKSTIDITKCIDFFESLEEMKHIVLKIRTKYNPDVTYVSEDELQRVWRECPNGLAEPTGPYSIESALLHLTDTEEDAFEEEMKELSFQLYSSPVGPSKPILDARRQRYLTDINITSALSNLLDRDAAEEIGSDPNDPVIYVTEQELRRLWNLHANDSWARPNRNFDIKSALLLMFAEEYEDEIDLSPREEEKIPESFNSLFDELDVFEEIEPCYPPAMSITTPDLESQNSVVPIIEYGNSYEKRLPGDYSLSNMDKNQPWTYLQNTVIQWDEYNLVNPPELPIWEVLGLPIGNNNTRAKMFADRRGGVPMDLNNVSDRNPARQIFNEELLTMSEDTYQLREYMERIQHELTQEEEYWKEAEEFFEASSAKYNQEQDEASAREKMVKTREERRRIIRSQERLAAFEEAKKVARKKGVIFNETEFESFYFKMHAEKFAEEDKQDSVEIPMGPYDIDDDFLEAQLIKPDIDYSQPHLKLEPMPKPMTFKGKIYTYEDVADDDSFGAGFGDEATEEDIWFKQSVDYLSRYTDQYLENHIEYSKRREELDYIERYIYCSTRGLDPNGEQFKAPIPMYLTPDKHRGVEYSDEIMELKSKRILMTKQEDVWVKYANETFGYNEEIEYFNNNFCTMRSQYDPTPTPLENRTHWAIDPKIVEKIQPVLEFANYLVKLQSTSNNTIIFDYYGPVRHVAGIRDMLRHMCKEHIPDLVDLRLETDRNYDPRDVSES